MYYLIVDDEVAICEGTAQRLRRFLPSGESIVCAFNGEEALEHIRNSPVDVLITDIRMGEMDGLSLIEQARAFKPGLACIVITAYDVFKYAQQAIKLEVKDFLVKPYGETELQEAVERVAAGLKKTKDQQHVLLEKHVSEVLAGGCELDRSLFKRSGATPPPDFIRVIVWEECGEKPPEWPGEWHYAVAERCCLLVNDDRDAVLRLVQEEKTQKMRFGISLAGDDAADLWKQAQMALKISGYENMPRWVFYQEAFSDEQTLWRCGP